MITTSVFHTTEERDGMLGSGMEGGMNETYARLDELLARRPLADGRPGQSARGRHSSTTSASIAGTPWSRKTEMR